MQILILLYFTLNYFTFIRANLCALINRQEPLLCKEEEQIQRERKTFKGKNEIVKARDWKKVPERNTMIKEESYKVLSSSALLA